MSAASLRPRNDGEEPGASEISLERANLQHAVV